MDIGSVNCKGEISWIICKYSYYGSDLMSILNLYIYTSYWYNCVTEPLWTECVDCGKVRYIFPLGNIYIYI